MDNLRLLQGFLFFSYIPSVLNLPLVLRRIPRRSSVIDAHHHHLIPKIVSWPFVSPVVYFVTLDTY